MKPTRSALLLLALVAAVAGLEAAPTVDLVKGARKPVIVVPNAQRGETLKGGLEVARYLRKITGREVPVICEGSGVYRRGGRNMRVVPFARVGGRPAGTPEIHVGWTARALKSLERKRVDALDIDGFLIRVTPDAVFLVGPKDWSTGYACHTFLEDLCGVRWYLPGEFGEDVPRRETLSVPLMDKTFEPAYKHRQYSGFGWRDRQALREWKARRKMRPRLQYHHNLFRVFDVRKYGKKHPDLYCILRRRRRVPGPNNKGGWQPCLSHPMAVDVAMDYARDYFKKRPDAASISLGINDGGGYCECPRCMKLVDKSMPSQGDRSRWFFQFANAVAERFDKEFPDKQIGYLLYGHCKMFPKGMKVHPRLIGFYVSPSFRLITAQGKKDFDAGLAELTKHVSRFALYDWFYGDGVCVPRMQIRQAKYWLEHGYKMGARHCKAEAYMNWGLDGFKYWMHTKLLWDPSLSVDKMMDEFYPRFFKNAAKPMRQYFKVVEEYTTRPVKMRLRNRQGELSEPRAVNFLFRQPEQLESFPPEAVKRCVPLLDRAERMAQSGIVRERVKYFRTAFEVARMMTLQYHHAKQALPLLQKPETLAKGMPLIAAAMSKDLDVPLYYKWVLRDDPYCVRAPERSMYGRVTLCRATAARTLNTQIIDALRLRGAARISADMLNSTIDAAMANALAGIADADTRDALKLSVEPAVRKIILCDRAPAPKIDGRLDDVCWQTAHKSGGFSALGSGKPTAYPTEVHVSHDGARLYVAYHCRQDPKVILAWTKERDGRLWREDGVELLVNRPTDTSMKQNFQVITNTRGNIYDSYRPGVDWDGDIKTACAFVPDGYTIEMSIPLKEIGLDPRRDRFLRVNFSRNTFARKTLGTGRPKEFSAWYLTPYGNRDPRARGWLVFNP